MYLNIGNNQLIPARRIIGIFDLEITSQSRITAQYLKSAENESIVVDACEDIPKSFLVCDHPYHRQIVYLSQLGSRTLLGRAEEQEKLPRSAFHAALGMPGASPQRKEKKI